LVSLSRHGSRDAGPCAESLYLSKVELRGCSCNAGAGVGLQGQHVCRLVGFWVHVGGVLTQSGTSIEAADLIESLSGLALSAPASNREVTGPDHGREVSTHFVGCTRKRGSLRGHVGLLRIPQSGNF